MLLKIKLHRPTARPGAAPRPRLTERLGASSRSKLTLVSALAGLGEITLLAGWKSEAEQAVAWLSLDGGDNDATRFLSHVITALQAVDPTWGRAAAVFFQAPQPSALLSVVATLVDGLMAADSKRLTARKARHEAPFQTTNSKRRCSHDFATALP